MEIKKIFLVLVIMLISVPCMQAQYNVKLHIRGGITDTTVKTAVETNTFLLLSEFDRAFLEEGTPDFTGISISSEAAETILSIWDNISVMICRASELNKKSIKRCDGGYQVRDIPVFMPNVTSDDTLHKIVLNYTDNGTIDEIYFSVNSISAILQEESDDKEKCRRQKIIDFIDRYYMAYSVRDLDFIRNVFESDIFRKKRKDLPIKTIDYEMIYKEQYLRKLKFVYNMNRDINLEITEIEIRKHPKYPEIYGIVIKQKINTNIYYDVSYVFWLIDFENENDPVIHISSLYPDNMETERMTKDKIFNRNDFNIYTIE
jgi:hypothetical protein